VYILRDIRVVVVVVVVVVFTGINNFTVLLTLTFITRQPFHLDPTSLLANRTMSVKRYHQRASPKTESFRNRLRHLQTSAVDMA